MNNNEMKIAKNGMVSTAKLEASQIGIEIIEQGGTAIDAAVAVGFALGVCEPNASGLGGGGFMTIRLGESKETRFIDFREVAPNKSKPSMWAIDADGSVVDDAKSQGGQSVCIPGEAAGLVHVLNQYGTMSLEQVMAPAIKLAREGFSISKILWNDLDKCREKFLKFEEKGNPYLGDFQVKDIFKNEALAKTLESISLNGISQVYQGAIGTKIVDSINKHSGQATIEDMMNFSVNEYEPIVGSYRGYKIISSPPPSSGGTHIIQMLNILEQFDIASHEVNSFEYMHILSEVFKMCFSDRLNYMGDPNYTRVPIEGITSKAYAKVLFEKIDMARAMPASSDNPFDFEPKDTTHYSIGDKGGNMVSVTKTISAFFGSGLVPEDTGIVLNCQMRGFALGEGKANSVGPNKKPLSSMSPTIILKDDKPFAIVGSPGGNRIIPIVVQVISKLIDYEMTIKEAIESPRMSNDVNEILCCESRIDPAVIDKLKEIGHEIDLLGDFDRKLGGVQGVRYVNEHIEGAADPRRDGIAIGY